jgi:hypothetical protein
MPVAVDRASRYADIRSITRERCSPSDDHSD